MRDFNATAATRSNLRFAPSPGPSKLLPGAAPWLHQGRAVEIATELLVNIRGECVYASSALAALLQCGLHELYGDGWRVRLSPFAMDPFDYTKAVEMAVTKKPIRLFSPNGRKALITRIRTVTDPGDPTQVTGFYGRVQCVRIHRRAAVAVSLVTALVASA